ncbi:NUDIX hydrolase [Thermoflexibacter ruber]|uniref:ADP-ribose pyrophosphatase YjhB, NUDIX family n=1 Tax=Thermoflexibacter ruber TaxID=1003 RepID=A0A1I2EUM7_9BACT|nr:NUDIX domain-containing protein [Thermoflexibacter ruber]SFE96317.1 ADP-ribose pyrophosphatase YjhB, NUDIX family [Thermoflexibacter ruber]
MQIFTNEVLINIFDEPLEFSEGVYAKASTASEIIRVYEQIKSAITPLSRQYHFEVIDYDKVVQDFKSHFKVIKAAGGIVTKKDKILFIKRLGKWDFPKGKIDKGEEEETAAVREVAEECGVSTVIKSKIGTTWHTYLQGGQDILKKTVWFEMECVDDTNLKPQIEEDISAIAWGKLYKADKYLANTYQSIRSIYQKFLMKKMKKLLKANKKQNKEASPYIA